MKRYVEIPQNPNKPTRIAALANKHTELTDDEIFHALAAVSRWRMSLSVLIPEKALPAFLNALDDAGAIWRFDGVRLRVDPPELQPDPLDAQLETVEELQDEIQGGEEPEPKTEIDPFVKYLCERPHTKRGLRTRWQFRIMSEEAYEAVFSRALSDGKIIQNGKTFTLAEGFKDALPETNE